jgi:succinate dehydrogenase / fumarate reductase membrane anchor subunit
MILLAITLFYHMALGLQVIAEDYLHIDRIKLLAIISIQFGCLVLAITGVVSILRMVT